MRAFGLPVLWLSLLLVACGPDDSAIPTIDNEATDASGRYAFSGLSPLAKAAAIRNEILAQNGFHTFEGKNKVRIAYAVHRATPERGAIVVLPGRTEAYLKYFEMVYDLRDLGYSFYLMDHRGQGLSGRMLSDPQRGFVGDFVDYVDDVKTFIDTVVTPSTSGQPILLSHSMGGAIATSYLETYPDDVRAAVLVSPMHQIDTGSFPEPIAQAIATAACAVGQGDHYAIGQSAYDPALLFADNDVTHDETRFKTNRILVQQNPSIALGGATYRWVKENIEGTWAVRFWADQVTKPLLLLQARMDKVVKISAQDGVCRAAQFCEKIAFAGAYHEILQEQDPIRDAALKAIRAFVEKLAD